MFVKGGGRAYARVLHLTMPDAPTTDTFLTLAELAETGFHPEKLDQQHDYLRLLGIVLGQIALLEVATMRITGKGDAAAKVAAARALMNTKEAPDTIAERLRRSAFADLNPEQLECIVQEVKKKDGRTLADIIEHVKHPEPQDVRATEQALP